MTSPEKPVSSVIVIGGGIIGLASALQLQRQGIDTLVVDATGARPSASWGNAGHIAVEQVEPLASRASLAGVPQRLFSRGGALGLPLRDLATWLPFACRLARAATPHRFAAGKAALSELLAQALPAWRRPLTPGGQRHLVADGHFVVWQTAAAARRGRAHWLQADIGGARVRDLTHEETARIGALIARVPAGGLYFEGTARVRDPGDLLLHLAVDTTKVDPVITARSSRPGRRRPAGASRRLFRQTSHVSASLLARWHHRFSMTRISSAQEAPRRS